jgi:type I restriction enzyme M protein
MTGVDVVQKLWGFCNTLRDEGMSYGHYIEQLHACSDKRLTF